MGIYNPPPPIASQGATNSTLPIPHQPVPTGGDPPPRRQVWLAATMAVLVAAWPGDLEPRLQSPNAQQQKIAPLTLPTGTPPPPQSARAALTLQTLAATWAVSWDAQSAPKSAAWNVPVVVVAAAPPYVPLPRLIWTAWEPAPVLLPARVGSVAPTLASGQAPPTQDPPSAVLVPLVLTWATAWDAQTAPHGAAWIAGLTSYVPPPAVPWAIYTANLLVDPVRLPSVAPIAPFTPTLQVTGITRDAGGSPLGGVTVKLFLTATNVLVGSTVSDGSGTYAITVPSAGPYYLYAVKHGTPDVSGGTDDTLVGS